MKNNNNLIQKKFEQVKQAIFTSYFGTLIPNEISNIIYQFRGFYDAFCWDIVGNDVIISNKNMTITQKNNSRSGVCNKIFKINTGVYIWKIKVNKSDKHGCKYIGIIRNNGLTQNNLNSNLQHGCRRRRVVWDGNCQKIYNDIDNGYNTLKIGIEYKTGDIITVKLDTNKRCIQFGLNGVMFQGNKNQDISALQYNGTYDVRAVIGFGSQINEEYTIYDYNWW